MNKFGLTEEELNIINGVDFDLQPLAEEPLPKRARRILDRERKIAEATKVLNEMFPLGWGERTAGHWADNLAKCSCHMCCNARRNPYAKGKDKLTRQELIENIRFEEQMKEVI